MPLLPAGARSYVRDFLRADGLGEKIGVINRTVTIHDLIEVVERQSVSI